MDARILTGHAHLIGDLLPDLMQPLERHALTILNMLVEVDAPVLVFDFVLIGRPLSRVTVRAREVEEYAAWWEGIFGRAFGVMP